MAVVAFVSQKGGVSKSTLSRALAVEARRSGLAVKVADLDPGQGSVTDWHKDRVAAGYEPDVAVQLYRSAAAAITDADGDELDLLIIDGPAKADKQTLAIAEKANLVVQPTGPSLDDLRPAVRTFHALVKAGVPKSRLLFVLSRVGTDAEAEAARAYLEEAGYAVAPGHVPERPTFRAAQDMGRAITEVRVASLRATADAVVQAIIDAATSEED